MFAWSSVAFCHRVMRLWKNSYSSTQHGLDTVLLVFRVVHSHQMCGKLLNIIVVDDSGYYIISCIHAGTYCLNSSFSSQVADWLNYNWSYSTAFYPGESGFSKKMAALVQETTGLKKENGGKFQITSYPLERGE